MQDTVLMLVIVAVLCFGLGYSFLQMRRKEGYEEYSEEQCLTLAEKNERNIAELEKNFEKIQELIDTVSAIRSQSEANTESIKGLLDNCKR